LAIFAGMTSPAVAIERADALAELASAAGPTRFAVVREGLYRGGQPTARHLELLRAAGVQTVIDLRLGDRTARREATEAARLGLRFVRMPMSGVFRVGPQLLTKVIDAIRDGGRVYVHCHIGRDRTSLVIALERVLLEGWDAAAAWQHDAFAFGYRPTLFHANIAESFKAAVAALVAAK
jgi:protein tyrosine/serine phosphatase